jgi:glycosyltransferase involved in cell wall biosynthesis
MKITFVMAGGFSMAGGARVVATYAERLLRRGHELLVVSQPSPEPTLKDQARSLLKGKGWVRSRADGPSHFDGTPVPRRLLDGSRLLEDRDVPDADVIISTWWETAEWVARLSSRKGAKVSFLQHYEAFDYVPKDRVDATWRLPFHRITISRWLVDLARNKFGDDKVSLVLNSVDTSQFHAPERGKQRAPTVGMMHSLLYWKGTDLGLSALALLNQKLSGVKLKAFGASEKEPGRAGPPLPSGTEYSFMPPQERIREIYANCDVWLCPSRTEGFHLPPLEAMACRCPVVSTAVGGPIDVVRDGENGYVVPVDDSAGLADRLHRVLTLPEAEWKRMSAAALDTATRYTWDDATVLFERALETAIARKKSGETV